MTPNEYAATHESADSRVEVRGSTQRWLLNKPAIKVYWNGDQVGTVQHGGRFSLDVISDGLIRFEYSVRSTEVPVEAGRVTKIQLSWDRVWGRLTARTA